MIITIDTAKDSKEDIRKAAAFLSSLHSENNSLEITNETEDVAPAFVNMFSSDETSQSESSQQPVQEFINPFAMDEKPKEVEKNIPFDDPLKMLSEIKEENEKSSEDQEFSKITTY